MSEQETNDFKKYTQELKLVVGLGWALIAGAFGLGIWVATLELRQSSVADRVLDHDTSLKNHGTELNMIHVKQAVNASDLAYIRSAIDRIEKKVSP